MSLKCTGTGIYLAYGTWISFRWGFEWLVPEKKMLCFISTEGLPSQQHKAVPTSCTQLVFCTPTISTPSEQQTFCGDLIYQAKCPFQKSTNCKAKVWAIALVSPIPEDDIPQEILFVPHLLHQQWCWS